VVDEANVPGEVTGPQDNGANADKEDDKEDDKPVVNPEAVQLDIDIRDGVKSRQDSGVIRKRVVEALVEEEVTTRADLLTKALAKRKAQQKELDKIKPDHCTFNEDGSPAQQHWSKAKLGERAKAAKALNKIDKAINAAVNNADYEGVKKIANG